jgi:hypothetical protein
MDALDDRKLLAAPARHGFGSDERRREVRRAIAMARLLDLGVEDNVVRLPRRAQGTAATIRAGESATILLFTGVTRQRHA